MKACGYPAGPGADPVPGPAGAVFGDADQSRGDRQAQQRAGGHRFPVHLDTGVTLGSTSRPDPLARGLDPQAIA
jgi:hypothetical protein